MVSQLFQTERSQILAFLKHVLTVREVAAKFVRSSSTSARTMSRNYQGIPSNNLVGNCRTPVLTPAVIALIKK